MSFADKKAGIIGTGGAARAATIGLIQAGIKEINYYSRNVINSAEMINYMRKTFPEIKFNNYQILYNSVFEYSTIEIIPLLNKPDRLWQGKVQLLPIHIRLCCRRRDIRL